MKIRINYDLMERVLDVNQKPGIFKIVRHHFKMNLVALTGFLGATIPLLGNPFSSRLLPTIMAILIGDILGSGILMPTLSNDKDYLKTDALEELRELSIELKKYISTTPELLAQSEEYKTKYKILRNENSLPFIAQEKYILVPTYDEYNGQIRKTFILQKHILGTSKYDLSLGSPQRSLQKTLKLAYHPI